MALIPIIIIFGAGVITGMYIATQVERKIDKDSKKKKKKN
jgi:uncharacterized protein YneF (UPF0154 family)